jgi:transmembrane sensor
MAQEIIDIANRFLADDACSGQELFELKKWLSDPSAHSEVESWLLENWEKSPEVESDVLIETIFEKIETYQMASWKKPAISTKRIIRAYQKVAAFLLIPLTAFALLYWTSVHQTAVPMTETFAPRGQKSQIMLADGTKVWLNSDTKIKYPGRFSRKRRDVYLEGEAFFDVAKNPHQPFIVHTSDVNVKVLGTKFNVKAYPEENHIEASLFEGKIDLMIEDPMTHQKIEKEVMPNQSFVYNKDNHQISSGIFPEEEINGWRNNQLIFKDDTFSNLVSKVERWYDVKIIYDERLFDDRRLTVELYEGERLERLMEIISLTLSVDYKYGEGEITLTPKKK